MKNGGKNKRVAFIILFSVCDEENCDISNILKHFRCRAVFLI